MAELTHTITLSEAEYRPCFVDGRKALFHKWERKQIPIIKFKGFHSDEELATKVNKFICDSRTDIVMQETNYGIVEYEDGTVDEVIPTKIRFVAGIMNDFYFDDVKYTKDRKSESEAETNAEAAKLLRDLPTCNDCGKHFNYNKICEYEPRLGERVRYNCPFYEPLSKDRNK